MSRLSLEIGLLLAGVWLLVGCGQTAATPIAVFEERVTVTATREMTGTPQPSTVEPVSVATATIRPISTPSPTATPISAPAVTPSPLPTASKTADPTTDPYAGLSIEALTAREYGGGQLEILETIEKTDSFTRYLIRYPSDGLDIYGFLNAPLEGWGLPVAIVLHGYVAPEKFKTVTYTRRYADALAEAGYMVVHPNYRNHAPSDFGENPFRIGFAVDILNLLAIIEEQSQDMIGPLRRFDAEKIYLLGHSMGGGIAQRVAVVRPESVDAVMLYASMNGDEGKNIEKIFQWSGRYGALEEQVSAEMLQTISPHNYVDRLQAPIAIHHSDADDVVPYAWSESLCEDLRNRQHPVNCYRYNGFPHTFYGEADEVLIARMLRFFAEN